MYIATTLSLKCKVSQDKRFAITGPFCEAFGNLLARLNLLDLYMRTIVGLLRVEVMVAIGRRGYMRADEGLNCV